MRVLYIDGVGAFGGACRSLYEAVNVLRKDHHVTPYFLAVRGTAADFYKDIASDMVTTRGVTRFDNTRYGYYRGLRWLICLRELAYLPYTITSVVKACRKWPDVELIHLNSVNEILPGLFAKVLLRVPMVVHVRAVQRIEIRSIRFRLMRWLLNKADAVVAIDETVKATIQYSGPIHVIHNAFTSKKSECSENAADQVFFNKFDALPQDHFKLAFVGGLLKSKGLLDLLEAAKEVVTQREKVLFLIVGESPRIDKGLKMWILWNLGLLQDIQSRLRTKIREYGLEASFLLLGETKNIKQVYDNIDVLCFPSHFNAPGRSIFEAAFSGKPSIVAVENPKPDTFIDGVTGIAVPQEAPKRLAEAIMFFIDNPDEKVTMGEQAQQLAFQNFNPITNAKKLLQVYQSCFQYKKMVGCQEGFSE